MHLQELTPAETAFLTAPAAAADDLQARLTRKLAATLSARLRLPVEARPMPADAGADAAACPTWQPDVALASLWLTRRLGGQRVMGATPFVPHTLIHTLDVALAECWLDAATQATLSAVLAWHITTGSTQATLVVRLPHPTTDMTRWARGVIRHG
ncbi:MAG: hypothetical protein CVU23_00815 [Betaproteobacteria bacterium HGW-Betaproteobacteria-17]|nr:MAG: hypothetical protein CVU23_00815 [Betaproteobacteria bacterium HGW-Betaproteobacteria-17]